MGAIIVAASVLASLGAGPQESVVRQFYQQRPIEELARAYPGRVVELDSPSSRPLLVMPPRDADPFVWMAEISDAVLRAELLSRESLIDGREREVSVVLPGTWIITRVRARVIEVLKESGRDFESGEEFTFIEDGGEVRLGDAVVRGVHRWARPLVVGGEYLLFARVLPDGTLVIGFSGAYERLENGRYRNHMVGIGSRESDVSAEVVLERIRQQGH
jgi:hypothetical protein